MNFSAADIPILSPDSFGHIFEQIRKNGPEQGGLTPAQIEDLAAKTDDCVAMAHSLLNDILQYDVIWRTSVFQGETEYDEAIEKRIESGLRSWAEGVEHLIEALDHFRSCGAPHSESMEALRPRLAEVRRMLTPDDQFFEGEELDDLVAEAIVDDEAGRTAEFRVMGE
jgi:hypothetical protein